MLVMAVRGDRLTQGQVCHLACLLAAGKRTTRNGRWLNSLRNGFARPVLFSEHTGAKMLKVLHGDAWNNRNDRAAQRACAHLNEVIDLASLTRLDHQDRTRLKATGSVSYEARDLAAFSLRLRSSWRKLR